MDLCNARAARIREAADFERVLAAASWARSAHFAAHYLHARPRTSRATAMHLISTELSTDRQRASTAAVDDAPLRPYLGAVVPKRHARRAVTRNLLKRQIRTAFERHLAALLPGLWVVRLRAPFDRARFVSAASDPLRREVGKELDALFGRASRRQP